MESSDSQEEVPETPSLRTQVVLSGDTTDERYSIGCLECGDSTPSVAIIAVAVVEDQVLVVVPDEAWARKRADRVLPPGALRRPASLKVASCVLTSRTGYPAAVRSGWALAGIWDALRAGGSTS